jgi:hypothetical protein
MRSGGYFRLFCMKPVGDEFAYCRQGERFAVDLPLELGQSFPDCPRSKLTLSNLLKLLCNLERLFAIRVSSRFSALPAANLRDQRKARTASDWLHARGVDPVDCQIPGDVRG